MTATAQTMTIIVEDREPGLREQLRERLRERFERASQLRCAEHGQPVVSVIIHGRENGWFDSRWITCCESLEQQAAAIVKQRC